MRAGPTRPSTPHPRLSRRVRILNWDLWPLHAPPTPAKLSSMFVSHVTRVSLPFETAADRFGNVVGDLAGLAHGAYREGEKVQARIGTGNPVLAKRVFLEIGQAARTSRELIVPVSWRATSTPHLFPRMDAQLTLAPATDDTTQVSFSGSYSVPFGPVGEFFDEALLHRVAKQTVENFVERVTGALIG